MLTGLAYETSSCIKSALEYNVYNRCLCYFLNQATVAEEQEFIRSLDILSFVAVFRHSYA